MAESYAWLAVMAAMAGVEAVSLTVVSVWFVVGALAAFLAAFFGAGLPVQIAVFLAVSLLCLFALRPAVLRHRAIGALHEPTPVGQGAVVVEAIDPEGHTGRVETPDRMTWAAVSADGQAIEKGAQVRVVSQSSTKLVVERV